MDHRRKNRLVAIGLIAVGAILFALCYYSLARYGVGLAFIGYAPWISRLAYLATGMVIVGLVIGLMSLRPRQNP